MSALITISKSHTRCSVSGGGINSSSEEPGADPEPGCPNCTPALLQLIFIPCVKRAAALQPPFFQMNFAPQT